MGARGRAFAAITTTVFGKPEMQQRIIDLSDVLSFHNYSTLPSLKHQVVSLPKYGRPLFCTDGWPAPMVAVSRHTFRFSRPKRLAVGTGGSWPGVHKPTFHGAPYSTPAAPEPSTWFHDNRRDGTAYRKYEVSTIRDVTGMSKTPPPAPFVLVPTAEKAPVRAARWNNRQPIGFGSVSTIPVGNSRRRRLASPIRKSAASRAPSGQVPASGCAREFEMPSGSFRNYADDSPR